MIAAKMGFEGCVKALLDAGEGAGGQEQRGSLDRNHEDGYSDDDECFFPGVDIDSVDGAGNTALHVRSLSRLPH